MTRYLLLLTLLVGMAFSQATLTLTGPATATPGSNITLTVTLAGSAGLNIAGIQTDIGLPAGITVISTAVGAASTAATKTIDCAVPAAGTQQICIIDEKNQTAYADGVVATYVFKLPTTPGNFTFTLTPVIANVAGSGVTIAAVAPFAIAIPSPCGVTGDFPVSTADVTAIRSAVENGTAPASFDLNGDGTVNEIDVRRVINALPAPQGTGVCKTGP